MPDVALQNDEWRQEVLRDWTDHRLVSDLWLDVHIWFYLHLYADLAKFGLDCQGWSIRQGDRESLMVIKLTEGDTPYVVFVTSSDPTHCMRKFRDLLRNGGPKLVPDRYR